MPGELWRRKVQIGKETTYGVPVAATRIAYLTNPVFTREVEAQEHRFATGTRDNVRAITYGPGAAGGSTSMPISSDELIEFLLVGIKGGVTPTTPSGATLARRWFFTPGTALDSMTVEEFDGADEWQTAGVHVGEFTFAGNVREAAQTVSMTIFGKDKVSLGALTGALSERTPNFAQGWQTRLFVDTFGGTAMTNQQSFAATSYEVTIGNGLDRIYTMDNTQSAQGISFGELTVTANITVLASSAFATAEFANWVTGTARLVTLSIGNNDQIESAPTNEVQTLTESGTITAGTYLISYRGQTTSAIAYNATAATIQTALEALGAIGTGGVLVAGGPVDTTPVTLTFRNQLGGLDVPAVTVNSTGLTGGTVTVTTSTPGVGFKRAVNITIPGKWSVFDMGGDVNGVRAYQLTMSYLYDSTNAYGVAIECINNRTAAFA